MTDFNVQFNNAQTMDVAFNEDSFGCDFGPGVPIGDYTGPYNVTPSAEEQTLPTKYRTLENDITVDAVALGSVAMDDVSATINPILTVDDEGIITASVNDTMTLTPTVTPGYVSGGSSGILTATGNTQYQMYKRTSADLTETDGTVTAPLGYYPQNASKTVEIKPVLMRPDAEKIATYTYDKWAVEDEGLTLPAYSTSAQTIMASANLEPTLSLSFNDYDYYVVQRHFCYPTYSITTKAKGRVEYYFASYCYEASAIPGGTYIAFVNGTTKISGNSVMNAATTAARLFYWSSGSAVALYSSTSTGLYMTPVSPTISSSVMTIKSPTFGTKGSGTYFSSTFANAMTDVRFQYVIEVYRAPKGHLNVDGFSVLQNEQIIADCVNSATHKLL